MRSSCGLDIVVLLHGDGQYAPEVMQDLLTPLETGRGRDGAWDRA